MTSSVARSRATQPERARRQTGDRRALVTVTLSWLLVMTGANLAAPLYAGYAARFRFSSLVLTLVFATYAFSLIPTLLLFGRLSDRVGRRPVLLAGLAAAAAGLVVFALATSTPWLFAARFMQGVAVGMISGPATAALVELDPRRGERRPALLAGLAQAGGSGAGPLLAGTLAAWAPAPDRLCYLVVLGGTACAAVATWRLPEQSGGGNEKWRAQWPRVPGAIAAPFARVGITAGLAWGALALSLSIVPSYAANLGTSSLAALGALAAIALAASCSAQVVTQRLRPDVGRAQALGLVVIALGLALLALASPVRSLTLLVAAAIATGVGHGLAYLAAQDELNALAPAERRGEVTSAFVCCIYALVATAVISTGLLDLDLSLQTAVAGTAAMLAVTALAVAGWQVRRDS
ncbi:MAG TPA: MFS transporter [Gaiellaceae bacterium]|nr:MFS transporter [Gaiellaceae bacterium]